MGHGFIIYRKGSNAANQHMCELKPLFIDWDSNTVAEARAAFDADLFTFYANQVLVVVPVAEFEGTDDEFLELQDEIDEQWRGLRAEKESRELNTTTMRVEFAPDANRGSFAIDAIANTFDGRWHDAVDDMGYITLPTEYVQFLTDALEDDNRVIEYRIAA